MVEPAFGRGQDPAYRTPLFRHPRCHFYGSRQRQRKFPEPVRGFMPTDGSWGRASGSRYSFFGRRPHSPAYSPQIGSCSLVRQRLKNCSSPAKARGLVLSIVDSPRLLRLRGPLSDPDRDARFVAARVRVVPYLSMRVVKCNFSDDVPFPYLRALEKPALAEGVSGSRRVLQAGALQKSRCALVPLRPRQSAHRFR